MNQQFVQYGAHSAVDVNAQYPPDPYAALPPPGPHQQQQHQHRQVSYPAAVQAGPQQHSYYQQITAEHTRPQQQQQSYHALHQPGAQQYAPPAVASPSPGHSGPGAPPPELNSPSPLQYGDVLNSTGRVAEEDGDDGSQPEEDNGPEPVFHLPPPPEATYETIAALDEAVHSWSLEHGYELVRRASKKNAKGVLYKRYVHCSRHGKPANTGKLTSETRQRFNRQSSRINCPMSIAVVAVDPLQPDGQWQVRHRKTHHNHGPRDALKLAGHRRRARAGGIEKAVDGLLAIGTPTAQVLQFLQRTNPQGLFTRNDVANMKLKYNKFGTCLVKADTSSHGRPCDECRARKIKCNNRRPTCAACRDAKKTCVYDHPPEEDAENADVTQPAVPDNNGDTEATPNQHNSTAGQQAARPSRGRNGCVSEWPQNRARAEEILANLQAFQTEHVAPTKLDFQSSAVEILAASSCGNGESYQNVPILTSASDWPAYRDLMTEACMKENTFDVLIATKTEPIQPPNDCKVEEWNEYVKKSAIFSRRNTALTAALWGSLAPTFRNRVQKLSKASEIWAVLEDACLPRGSQTGFKLYMDLHNMTRANSTDLKDYIQRLEDAYTALNRLSTHWHAQNDPPGTRIARATGNVTPFSSIHTIHPSSTVPVTADIFTEQMLCFLFLRNLGPEYQPWVESVCATNNVAGFGTGPSLRFVDLTRRALETENSLRTTR